MVKPGMLLALTLGTTGCGFFYNDPEPLYCDTAWAERSDIDTATYEDQWNDSLYAFEARWNDSSGEFSCDCDDYSGDWNETLRQEGGDDLEGFYKYNCQIEDSESDPFESCLVGNCYSVDVSFTVDQKAPNGQDWDGEGSNPNDTMPDLFVCLESRAGITSGTEEMGCSTVTDNNFSQSWVWFWDAAEESEYILTLRFYEHDVLVDVGSPDYNITEDTSPW